MSDHPAKQKVVEKLKSSETVLVTVSSNPSVDELSAALGLTVLLNKLNKHATAVFSGDIPPAITFLDPEKTFENTVDSLRDFIIALDKERADHLRYKVEGDMVKIFITPYRTTIDQQDFEFSQGDYNVEMVIAIGVQSEDDLDRALSGHGRILHDAVVASLSVGEDKSQLGTITWHDDEASSYSEVMVDLAESLKGSKNPIDEQIATAFLTGIVAATDRFSNNKTSAKAMTIAAQLMAAGANQQLIANKLEEADEIGDRLSDDASTADSTKTNNSLDSDVDKAGSMSSVLKVERGDNSAEEPVEIVKDEPAADGTMSISHQKMGTVDEVAEQVALERQKEATQHAEEQLADNLAEATKAANVPSVEDLKRDLERASEEAEEAASEPVASSLPDEPMLPAPLMPTDTVGQLDVSNEPRLGGTLNATSQQAAEDNRRELEDDRNKTILSHDTGGYLETPSPTPSTDNSHNQTISMTSIPDESSVDDPVELHPFSQRGKTINPISDPEEPTLADIDTDNRGQYDARSEIEQVFGQSPNLEFTAGESVLPPLPPMPDFSTLPDMPFSNPAETNSFIPAPPPSMQTPIVQQADPAALFTPQPAYQAPVVAPESFQPPVAVERQVQQEQALSDRLGDILPPAQPLASVSQPTQPSDPAQFQIPN